MLKYIITLFVITVELTLYAQTVDSLVNNSLIEEIVITATKTETKIENSTVPLSVIIKKYIKAILVK